MTNVLDSFQRYVHPSGLAVATICAPHVRKIRYNLGIGVGSSVENGGEFGVAHFLEHVIGTSLEVELGLNVYAETTHTETSFSGRVPADKFSDLLTSIGRNLCLPSFDPDILNTERSRILREDFENPDEPEDHLEGLVPGNLIRHILGDSEFVSNVTEKEIIEFRDRTYGLSGITLGIVSPTPIDSQIVANKLVYACSFVNDYTSFEPGILARQLDTDIRMSAPIDEYADLAIVRFFAANMTKPEDEPAEAILDALLEQYIFAELSHKAGAIYAVESDMQVKGPITILSYGVNVDNDSVDLARRAILGACERLVNGKIPGDVFERAREGVIDQTDDIT